MKMIFFNKCIIYMQGEDLVIHSKVRVQNVFRFSFEDEEYCETLVDLLIKHADYSPMELALETNLLLLFIKLVKELTIDEYELAIKIKEYCKEKMRQWNL